MFPPTSSVKEMLRGKTADRDLTSLLCNKSCHNNFLQWFMNFVYLKPENSVDPSIEQREFSL